MVPGSADEAAALDQHAHDPILVFFARAGHPKGVPYKGAPPTRRNDQICLEAAPAFKLQHPFGSRRDRLRACYDLYARTRGRSQDAGVEMLARHRHQQERVAAVDVLEADADTVAPRFIAWRLMRAARHVWIGADRLQNALAILPNKNARAEGAQLCLLLVYAHAPTPLVERDGRGEPRKPRSGNFCMHGVDPKGSGARAG